MRSNSKLWLGVAGSLLLATAGHAGSESGSIHVLSRAQVNGDRILLGELGRLSGDAVDFGEIDLGHSPDAGTSRRITGSMILARLRDAGLDEDRIRYKIPASVRILRAYQEVDPEDLRVAIERRMVDWLPAGDEVEDIELPPRLRVPLGDYDIHVDAPKAAGRHAHETEIEIEQDGRVVARAPARLRISSRGEVLVARRPVPRGATLTSEDLRVEERALRGLPATLLAHPEEAIGRLARISLAPGTVLTARSVEAPILVERGDVVRVSIETSGMRLTVPGEALDSASLGERVRLLNPTSGREFTAEVIAHGKVLVHY